MSAKTHIKHRLQKHGDSQPMTALERSRKLKSLHVTQSKLHVFISSCMKTIRTTNHDMQEAKSQLDDINAQIVELSADSAPIVTEHALLRYVERHMGINLEKAHEEILKLPESEVVRAGNTIITCFTDPNDHFNLAERESDEC